MNFSTQILNTAWLTLCFIVMPLTLLANDIIQANSGEIKQEKEMETEIDYTKLSAVEVVNLFSGELLDNISEWDKSRKQDNEKFISELDDWGRPWFNQRRLAAGIMGREYYLKASKQQRLKFTDVLFNSLIKNYAQGLFIVKVTDIEIVSDKSRKNPKYHTVVQRVASGDDDTEIEYLLYRKSDKDYWKVVNVIANNINFQRTLRGSFKRLAQRHSGDIDAVIANWDNTEITKPNQ